MWSRVGFFALRYMCTNSASTPLQTVGVGVEKKEQKENQLESNREIKSTFPLLIKRKATMADHEEYVTSTK